MYIFVDRKYFDWVLITSYLIIGRVSTNNEGVGDTFIPRAIALRPSACLNHTCFYVQGSLSVMNGARVAEENDSAK
ncbi:hypothetical protein [Marinilabilia salmonicolor]|uniref:hypothetical protein n=1 Tax=Marinilabilia salmonicolor TaxID=989 RepID=UPI000299D9D9|nr:hypothetical protein [Marinilabilia salmonicolor]